MIQHSFWFDLLTLELHSIYCTAPFDSLFIYSKLCVETGAAGHHHACLSLFGRSQVVTELNPAKKSMCSIHMMVDSWLQFFLLITWILCTMPLLVDLRWPWPHPHIKDCCLGIGLLLSSSLINPLRQVILILLTDCSTHIK
jgi:hypothetical protein